MASFDLTLPAALREPFGGDASKYLRDAKRPHPCLLIVRSADGSMHSEGNFGQSTVRARLSLESFLPTIEVSWGSHIGQHPNIKFEAHEVLVLDPDASSNLAVARHDITELNANGTLAELAAYDFGSQGVQDKDTGIITVIYAAATAPPRFQCSTAALQDNILQAAGTDGAQIMLVYALRYKAGKTAGDEEEFERWHQAAVDWRALAASGAPRNDWFWSHHPAHSDKTTPDWIGVGFSVMKGPSGYLPCPPWVRVPPKKDATTHAASTIARDADEASEGQLVFLDRSRTLRIPNAAAYRDLYSAAAIFEYQSMRFQYCETVNNTHEADFAWNTDTQLWTITLDNLDELFYEELPILPSEAAPFELRALSHPDAVFTGTRREVRDGAGPGLQFSARNPWGVDTASFGARGPLTVAVKLPAIDDELLSQLQALKEVGEWLAAPRPTAPGFDVRTALLGVPAIQPGYDAYAAWDGEGKTGDFGADMLQATGGKLNGMNKRQYEVCQCAWRGTPGGLLVCDGLPGTGKTTALAVMLLGFAALGLRIGVHSYSHITTDQPILKFREMARAIGCNQWALRVVRPGTQSEEWALDDTLQRTVSYLCDDEDARMRWARQPDLPVRKNKVEPALDDVGLIVSMLAWAREHEHEKVAQEFWAWREYVMALKHARKPEKTTATSYLDARRRLAEAVLAQAFVIACTAATARTFGQLFDVDVVVLDDVGEMKELEAALALSRQRRVKQVVIAGDEKQLLRVLASKRVAGNPLSDVLGRSPIDRWPVQGSMKVTLNANVRSHKTIIALLKRTSYKDLISDSKSTIFRPTKLTDDCQRALAGLPEVGRSHCGGRVLWLDVDSPSAIQPHGHSRYNLGGDHAICRVIRALLDEGVPAKAIGIITAHQYDVQILTQLLREVYDVRRVTVRSDEDLNCATVNNYQGRQKEVIFYHFVVRGTVDDPIGFPANPHHLNLALSRPRQILFLVGSFTRLRYPVKVSHNAKKVLGSLTTWIAEQEAVVRWSRAVMTKPSTM